ncbi:MAG TPA: hypothetical protein VJH92_05300 [Candidatus Nanoarchaeia archaeon]|nr:hypothetical protein [Candidatus Nanoarchaeia archaeon]
MGLIDRLFGIKVVKTKDYTSLGESLINLEQEKTRIEDEKINAEVEKNRLIRELNQSERSKNLAIQEMQEAMALAESYLKDQKEAEKRYQEAHRLLSGVVRNGNHLSKTEKLVLEEYIIPCVSDTTPGDKISLGSYHSYPRGTDKFIEKISKCPYVSEVKRLRSIGPGAKKATLRIIEEPQELRKNGYKIMAVYVNQTGAEIQITTTAKNDVQHEYVYRVLLKELNLE